MEMALPSYFQIRHAVEFEFLDLVIEHFAPRFHRRHAIRRRLQTGARRVDRVRIDLVQSRGLQLADHLQILETLREARVDLDESSGHAGKIPRQRQLLSRLFVGIEMTNVKFGFKFLTKNVADV